MSFEVRRGNLVRRISVPSSAIGWTLLFLIAVQSGLAIGLSYSVTHVAWLFGLVAEPWPTLSESTQIAFALAVALHFVVSAAVGWALVGMLGATSPSMRNHLALVAGSCTARWLTAWWLCGSLILIGTVVPNPFVQASLLVVGPLASCVTAWPAFRGMYRIWVRNASEPYFAGLDEHEALRLQPSFSPRPLTGLAAVNTISRSAQARKYARLATSMSGNREFAGRVVILVATAAFGVGFAKFAETFELEGTDGPGAVPRALVQLGLPGMLFLFGLSLGARSSAYGRAADGLLARADELDIQKTHPKYNHHVNRSISALERWFQRRPQVGPDLTTEHRQEQTMTMHNRPHPGEVLADQLGPEGLDLSVVEAAPKLGMSRPALSRVLNGRAGISTNLALALERNEIGNAELWLRMQMRYDLEHARAHKQAEKTR